MKTLCNEDRSSTVKSECERTSYIFTGIPIPLNRPRFARGIAYDDQYLIKRAKRFELRKQHLGDYYTRPVQVELIFYMPIPIVYRKQTPQYHIKRPDTDNMIKFYLDVATEVLWQDDCIVAVINASKIYDQVPRTVMTITEL